MEMLVMHDVSVARVVSQQGHSRHGRIHQRLDTDLLRDFLFDFRQPALDSLGVYPQVSRSVDGVAVHRYRAAAGPE